MTSRATKAKRKAIPTFTLAELDRQKGIDENYDHLMDPLDKWLLAVERKEAARKGQTEDRSARS